MYFCLPQSKQITNDCIPNNTYSSIAFGFSHRLLNSNIYFQSKVFEMFACSIKQGELVLKCLFAQLKQGTNDSEMFVCPS